MRFIPLILIFVCMFCNSVRAADTWSATYGTEADERAAMVRPAPDGGYILAGTTSPLEYGDSDLWALKLSATGTLAWHTSLGGRFDDQATAVIPSEDGSYLLAGDSDPEHGELLLIGLQGTGKAAWRKVLPRPPGAHLRAIIPTSDGGYMAAAETGVFVPGAGIWSDLMFLKFKATGHLLWEKHYDEKPIDRVSAMVETHDGGFIAAGAAGDMAGGAMDLVVHKLDAYGRIKWQKTFSFDEVTQPQDILETASGDLLILANTASAADFAAARAFTTRIIRITQSGELLWQKPYEGMGCDFSSDMVQTGDGWFVVAGTSGMSGCVQKDVRVFKIDGDGELKWVRTHGDGGEDVATSVVETPEAGLVVAGYTDSFGMGQYDVWVMQLDPFGRGDEQPVSHRIENP